MKKQRDVDEDEDENENERPGAPLFPMLPCSSVLYPNSIVTRRPPTALGSLEPPRKREAAPPWAAEIVEQAALRALPESWAADFADRFEAGWRKALKNDVPSEWPSSFRERVLGAVYREFLDHLRAEDLRGAIKDRLERGIASSLTPHMTRAQVKKITSAEAARLAEAWIEPLLDEAAMSAAARIQDEIVGARSMIRRIRQLRPKELHRFAAQYNWDDGYLYLFEVIRSPNCALATAVMLYRQGRPHCFLQYSSRREVPGYCVDNYDLLVEIEEGIRRGVFQEHAVRYDQRLALVDPMTTPAPTGAKRRVMQARKLDEAASGRGSTSTSMSAPLHSSRQVKRTAAARRTLSGPTRALRSAR